MLWSPEALLLCAFAPPRLFFLYTFTLDFRIPHSVFPIPNSFCLAIRVKTETLASFAEPRGLEVLGRQAAAASGKEHPFGGSPQEPSPIFVAEEIQPRAD